MSSLSSNLQRRIFLPVEQYSQEISTMSASWLRNQFPFSFFPTKNECHSTVLIIHGKERTSSEIIHSLKSAIRQPNITTLLFRGVNFENNKLRTAALNLIHSNRTWECIGVSNCTSSGGQELNSVLQAIVATSAKRLLLKETCLIGAIGILEQGLRTNKAVTQLDLFACYLEDADLAVLVRALVSHPSLQKLDLACNRCRAEGLKAISALLSSNPKHLQVIDMVDQGLVDDQTLDLALLESGLTTNTNLHLLTLSMNKLSGVSNLARSLTRNNALRALRLNSCDLSTNDMKDFAKHLPQMNGLKNLWLSGSQQWNKKDEECVVVIDAIREALQRNYDMEAIYFPNSIQDNIIQHILDWNRGGRRLLLAQPNTFSSVCWPLVLERAMRVQLSTGIQQPNLSARRVDILYNLLRSGSVIETR